MLLQYPLYYTYGYKNTSFLLLFKYQTYTVLSRANKVYQEQINSWSRANSTNSCSHATVEDVIKKYSRQNLSKKQVCVII